MPSLPASTVLSKVNFFLAVVSLTMYCVGGLISQWITASFTLDPFVPGVSVDVHMGLLEYCKKARQGNVTTSDCSSDGAEDWQKAAAGLAFVGGVAGLVCLVLALLNLTIPRIAGRKWTKVSMAASGLSAAGFMAGALALYGKNKEIQVQPPLPLIIDFDIGWAFVVSAISGCFYVVLALLALVDICCQPDGRGEIQRTNKKEEATVHYTNSVMT